MRSRPPRNRSLSRPHRPQRWFLPGAPAASPWPGGRCSGQTPPWLLLLSSQARFLPNQKKKKRRKKLWKNLSKPQNHSNSSRRGRRGVCAGKRGARGRWCSASGARCGSMRIVWAWRRLQTSPCTTSASSASHALTSSAPVETQLPGQSLSAVSAVPLSSTAPASASPSVRSPPRANLVLVNDLTFALVVSLSSSSNNNSIPNANRQFKHQQHHQQISRRPLSQPLLLLRVRGRRSGRKKALLE